ncbi:MAG: tetratricopeptide repeat protein [Erythrobacter sp.]|jgi:TolA-binding protein|nr:tetratricopeptide repeat protein [Erythrobacter sp.]
MTKAPAFRFPRPATSFLGAALAACVLATSPAPAFAQDSGSEARLRKIEAEIRALQRNVFPGGDGRFFEPQITREGEAATSQQPANPSTSAITDVLARLDALELQLQRLTALTEENGNALSRLDERVAALEAAQPASAIAPARSETGATGSNLAAMSGGETQVETPGGGEEQRIETAAVSTGSAAASSAGSTGPSPERLAAVQAITKPDTGDAGEDEYTYGFRLWDAGLYPEARQQLTSFVEAYPDHPLVTFGRNLLGRAFLDDGMAEEAARWFLRNYQADRTARRAPDSLLYLAESMIAMGDDRRACIALAEFGETYAAIATGRLADEYEANRRKVTCE